MTLKEHVIDAGENPDDLRSHLVFGHKVEPNGDHRDMDQAHIAAHRTGQVTDLHAEEASA